LTKSVYLVILYCNIRFLDFKNSLLCGGFSGIHHSTSISLK
jgi:hypothetical protein